MKRISLIALSFILFPLLTLAQATTTPSSGTGLQNFFKNLLNFINNAVIPFIVGIAFLFFMINAIRFFVIESTNEDGREKAKDLAIYGVLAFVFIIVFWGIVNLFSSSIGLEGEKAPVADYVQMNTPKS